MIGISQIGTYIPETRVSNLERGERFGFDEGFVLDKLGVRRTAVADGEDTRTLCMRAYERLADKAHMDKNAVEALAVVTQTPDRNIPHTSAEVHGALGLATHCACFDVSLGCSGYVYSLSILTAFMEQNGLRTGVLITADPYSRIVDENDKNTVLLFGDAATATLLTDSPRYVAGAYTFGTLGTEAGQLALRDGRLFMNGRAVFNFAARFVPEDVGEAARRNGLAVGDIDAFVFHQGSKYMLDTVRNRLGLPTGKGEFVAGDYGNTVSSSIPVILEHEIFRPQNRHILVSGFGLGFSWASTVLKRVQD